MIQLKSICDKKEASDGTRVLITRTLPETECDYDIWEKDLAPSEKTLAMSNGLENDIDSFEPESSYIEELELKKEKLNYWAKRIDKETITLLCYCDKPSSCRCCKSILSNYLTYYWAKNIYKDMNMEELSLKIPVKIDKNIASETPVSIPANTIFMNDIEALYGYWLNIYVYIGRDFCAGGFLSWEFEKELSIYASKKLSILEKLLPEEVILKLEMESCRTYFFDVYKDYYDEDAADLANRLLYLNQELKKLTSNDSI